MGICVTSDSIPRTTHLLCSKDILFTPVLIPLVLNQTRRKIYALQLTGAGKQSILMIFSLAFSHLIYVPATTYTVRIKCVLWFSYLCAWVRKIDRCRYVCLLNSS
ncbi:hypothetical protein I7I48_08213 [Histoplasma ohiense]|nr:hypothetical protein I7I48_08213 [Histoplasma ohiense (nom. inval.)]